MTIDQRIRLILDGPFATFARGGGGAKGGKGKAGKAKKAKGLGQGSTKGGKCCKTKDGKFAPGNNYGSKGGGSGGSLKAGGKAGQRAISSLVARTRAAQAAAGAAKQARAAKAAAATPARGAAIGRMVGKSRETAGNKMVAKTEREMAARNAAERGKAVGRMVGKSREASAKKAEAAKAPTKASGRGTPEEMRAARRREVRAAERAGEELDFMGQKTGGKYPYARRVAEARKELAARRAAKGSEKKAAESAARAEGRKKAIERMVTKSTSTIEDRYRATQAKVLKAKRRERSQVQARAESARKARITAMRSGGTTTTKAVGRGTPERAARAAALKADRLKSKALVAVRDIRTRKGVTKEQEAKADQKVREWMEADVKRAVAVRRAERERSVAELRDRGWKAAPPPPPAPPKRGLFDMSPTTRAERAPTIKRLTSKSKVAAARAGAVMKGPVTAENIAARGRAARKAQARDVARSSANRPAQPASDRGAVQAARAAMRARSAAEVASRPKTTPVQTVPHRVGSVPRRDVAGQVAATTARIDAGRKASGRGTPERAAKAAALRAGRAKAGAASLPPIAGKQSERSKRDLAGAAPAGPTSATARTMVARGMARERMVRASREAAQGARMVATKRARAAAAAKAPARAAGRGTPERAAVATTAREARVAAQKLRAIGPEPPKPSPDRRFYGTRGKEGASPEVRASHEAEVKKYNSWNRKYLKLKKEQVAASNKLFYARQKLRSRATS